MRRSAFHGFSLVEFVARTGLVVKAALDTHHYDTAVKISDDELAKLKLSPHPFHGDWNYTINPRA